MQNKVLIVDFGSQYTQLIARRIRELFIYCEISPFNNIPSDLDQFKAIVLSGSPFSVNQVDSPDIDLERLIDGRPVIAICYGAQLIAKKLNGIVENSNSREYGRAKLSFIDSNCSLFKDINLNNQVWMSHGDTITKLPENAKLVASTDSVNNAAYSIESINLYALQFHPEVFHTENGLKIFENFFINELNFIQEWNPESFIDRTVDFLKSKLKDDKVILGLSGGVDSSVAAVLLQKAIGGNLHCIFVNNGLLRKNEYDEVLEQYVGMRLNVKGIDSSDLFINALKGITDPEKKRKIIGNMFIEVFEKESKKIENAKWLAQGTIYPDVIESISVKGPSATIKSHHNVGGLPEKMNLKVVEPLKMLFKDEVRKIGKSLEMSRNILNRHPFPGPGLGIRILGEVDMESVRLIQEADKIYIDGLKKWKLYDKIWQAGSILLPVKSVGVMGDERTYERCVALRAVVSTDGMTADWYEFPNDFLKEVSNNIINKVSGINRVVYDISSKPPATIEWE
ncbi:MAG: glutamine-hydrolyzing GMP synthase [Flavobacteriales bacterium]|nr:MAG: glutamine-hydrolyzing GMP synthase [Flavobacteriales bacterium]CAI8342228.1 MAG: GMP synthase [glutamine-hydrolyzing] [Flavobacteriales bacterium]|tara:strand:+ start:2177 stop:3706 length:1530 start_codon:yes stop_codon:yes gene_type:complete